MLPSIAQLASKYDIAPLKKYGQNFIFDESLCDKIVKYSGNVTNMEVLEIGPGPAGLTRSILKAGPERLTVIETDERCIELLEEVRKFYPNLNIKHADALKFKLSDIGISSGKKITIISNLPYNIGTPLLIAFLKKSEIISSMTFMLQKEVVDRIVAKPGTSQYGRLSVICQLLCDVEKCFDVSPKAFYPAPKIWSSIIRLVPKEIRPTLHLIEEVEKLTMSAFSGRRKMVKSSLKSAFPNSKIDELLSLANINKSLRAENLSPNDYFNLAKLLII